MKKLFFLIALLGLSMGPIALAADTAPITSGPTGEDRAAIYDGCYNGCYTESDTKEITLETQCKKSCQCLADDFDQYLTMDEFAKAEFDANNNPKDPKMKGLLEHCIKAGD